MAIKSNRQAAMNTDPKFPLKSQHTVKATPVLEIHIFLNLIFTELAMRIIFSNRTRYAI
ncbi:MAG: hypothetical protein LBD40_00575 [Puniceicoccales bacterium]|nr:hypothetical protein [Puniceicoccales bacterium]